MIKKEKEQNIKKMLVIVWGKEGTVHGNILLNRTGRHKRQKLNRFIL